MNTDKNTVSFLPDEEQGKFNTLFFPRKVQDENSIEKEIDDFLLRERQKSSLKIDLYKHFIQETSNSSFCGVWIDGAKGDGISWLSEKILCTFQNKIYADIGTPKSYILKEDKEITPQKLPEISTLIGKRQFINCATKSGLMKKSLLLSLSIICILIPVVLGVIANAVEIIDVTANLPLQIIIVTLCVLGIIGTIFSSLKSQTKKRLTDFLDTLHKTEINEDPRYIKLVKLLAEKISHLNTPRILVIDDFSSLHELSRNVLQKSYESKYENQQNKELWIVLNTNLAVSEQSKSWYNQEDIAKFQYAKLVTLKSKEKRELIKQYFTELHLELPQENLKCEVIKDLCSKYLSSTSIQEIKGQLEKLQERDEDTFRFLYLIASNAVPSEILCSREALIEKIKFSKNPKERDKYIPEILKKQTTPDERHLKVDFEHIQNFLKYYGNEKFRVRNDIVQYLEDRKEKTTLQTDLYHYCNGYWAMCWYFVFGKKRWKVSWIPKLAHHLKEAYCIDDNALRENMFDAHLLAIEKSMKYLLRKEMIGTIESALKLNIQEQNNIEEKLQHLVVYIAFAFLNFDYLPERKKLKEIGCETIYDFLKKDGIEPAKQLLSSEKYEFLTDEIIYVLIERCWEKKMFLHISDKRYTMRNAIEEIKELQTIINEYFIQSDFQSTNDTGQKIRNIALWVWIKTFDISTREFEKKQYDELVDNIEKLIHSFITYSEQCINCRNDIEQTMLYTTMQGTAYIIIASILTIKNTNRTIKNPRLEEFMQKIINLYRLKININDNWRAFDDVMRLMQLQALMWRQGNYVNRHYNLTIIRIQLYSCWNPEYTIADEQKHRFKDELGIIPTENHLNTLANFTLCNLYLKYSQEISSGYFQYACNFTENTEFTKSQLEYMFMCLVTYWNNNSSFLKKVMDCFVHCEKQYVNDILFYISQKVSTSYTHLINTLQKFKDEKSIEFFARILNNIKQKKTQEIKIEVIEAEASWKNFEFEQMDKNAKIKNRDIYEEFWEREENLPLCPYSRALDNLLYLENSLELEHSNELKNKIYTFLVREDLDYNDYSRHLLLACNYLNSYKENKDDKYNKVLDIVREQETVWIYKNNLSITKTVYETLECCCPREPKYSEALTKIKLKQTNKLFDNPVNVSAFDFLCHLCNVWLQRIISYEKIDVEQYNKIIQNTSNKKKFLDKYKRAPEVFVKMKVDDTAIDVPNAEYILINDIINSLLYQEDGNNIISEYQTIINDCNDKAYESLDLIIDLIMEINPSCTEIQRLKEQWEEQIIYDGESEEE